MGFCRQKLKKKERRVQVKIRLQVCAGWSFSTLSAKYIHGRKQQDKCKYMVTLLAKCYQLFSFTLAKESFVIKHA